MMSFFAGCVNDDMLPDCSSEEEKPAGNVYIRLQMDLNSDGPGDSRASSRADEGSTDPQTPGTSKENAVNTVDILVFDAATDKLAYVEFLDANRINKLTSADGVVVPIFAAQGQMVKIYAAVNMTEAMRRTFVIGAAMSDLSVSSTGSSYWDVINEFVPGSNGKQTELEAAGGGIPMTGRFKFTDKNFETEGDDVITISGEHFTEDNPLYVKADVSRIVAKVHVLALCPDLTDMQLKVKYVNTVDTEAEADPGDNWAKWIGWIRLDNVRYILNGTNKSTYIFPQSNGVASQYALKDLNMDLFSYRNGRRFTGFEDDFMYYSGMALHKENISAQSHFSQVEEFKQETYDNTTKKSNDVADRYTDGLYCAENYFNMPAAGSEDDLFCTERKDAIPMITHLSIAAKLTPRRIVVKKDFKEKMNLFVKDFVENPETFYKKYGLKPTDFTDSDKDRWNNIIKDRYFKNETDENVYRNEFRIIKTDSEADAADIINWSLMGNKLWSGDDADFERSKYPASTFFVYDTQYDGEQPAGAIWTQRYLYLTAGAVNAAKDENAKIKTYSVPHVGGWGYYYTYLDQLNLAANGEIPYRSSQVTRNTYYLVTVENFGYPGGSISRPEFIKVNTVPVGWDYSGRGHVTLH